MTAVTNCLIFPHLFLITWLFQLHQSFQTVWKDWWRWNNHRSGPDRWSAITQYINWHSDWLSRHTPGNWRHWQWQGMKAETETVIPVGVGGGHERSVLDTAREPQWRQHVWNISTTYALHNMSPSRLLVHNAPHLTFDWAQLRPSVNATHSDTLTGTIWPILC